MYAIIEESGRQYKVTPGESIKIDRQPPEDGKTITFDRVLLVAGQGEGAGEPKIGLPIVSGASVTADVVRVGKEKKIDIVKHKRRKGYTKKQGHRQPYLEVKITGINV